MQQPQLLDLLTWFTDGSLVVSGNFKNSGRVHMWWCFYLGWLVLWRIFCRFKTTSRIIITGWWSSTSSLRKTGFWALRGFLPRTSQAKGMRIVRRGSAPRAGDNNDWSGIRSQGVFRRRVGCHQLCFARDSQWGEGDKWLWDWLKDAQSDSLLRMEVASIPTYI